MAKFYISSTYEDLKECRRSVCDTLRRMHHEVVGMENYSASGQAPLQKVLSDVAGCDVYIGIFAWRYGYIPVAGNRDKKSITELEYRKAVETGKETLIFLLKDDAPWPVNLIDEGETRAKIKALRDGLKVEHTVRFFKDSEELAKEVTFAVNDFLINADGNGEVALPGGEAGGDKGTRDATEDGEGEKRFFLLEVSFWKTHARLVLAAFALLVIGLPAAYWAKVTYWPPAYPKELRYDFWLTDNLRDSWDYPEEQWFLEKGEGKSPNDGAVVVKSAQMVVPKDLKDRVFYDYRAEFKVRFKAGKRASWVLRAQRDGRSGYLFELECRGGTTLFLNGWLLKNNQKVAKLDGGKEALRYSKCCDPTDGIHAFVNVVGNRFDYSFTFESDPKHSNAETGETDSAHFEDGGSTFRWGSFGLLETDDASLMKVEYLYLTPLQSDLAPSISTPGRSSS